jgi:Fic family protein
MSSVKIEARAAKRLGEIERLLGRWEGAAEQAAPTVVVQSANLVNIAVDTARLTGCSCSLQQAVAVLRGKPTLTSAGDILTLQNAHAAYQRAGSWDPMRNDDLLDAHGVLMKGLSGDAGRFKNAHGMRELFRLLRQEGDLPPIIAAILFHAELRRLRPFGTGNGRTARLWQYALLRRASPLFEYAATESLLWEHQKQYEAAAAACRRSPTAGAAALVANAAPFIEHMLDVLLLALQRLDGQLHGRAETADDRKAKARKVLAKTWFSRKRYRGLFPTLSTASASRDLAQAVAAGRLVSRGAHALTEYRFR